MTTQSQNNLNELNENEEKTEATTSNVDSESLQQQLADSHNQMLRVAAEFENYRKRVMREKEDLRFHVTEGLLKEFLPVMDNLDRALQLMKANDETSIQSLLTGVSLVKKMFLAALEKFQILPVDAENQMFDPNLHEAVQQVESSTLASGMVATVFQQGYKLGNRLIRPALVAVVK